MNSTQKLALVLPKVSDVTDLCIARNECRWADVRLMIIEYIYNYGVFSALTTFDDVHLMFPQIRGMTAKAMSVGDEDNANYALSGIIGAIMDLAGGIRGFIEEKM